MNKTLHRDELLRKYVEKWVHLEGMNQIRVTMLFMDQYESLGLRELLADKDIHFFFTGDYHRDAERNRVKLFRDLGVYDAGDKARFDRVMHYERALIAAMPEPIRISYLNECLNGCKTNVSAALNAEDNFSGAEALLKETTEAVSALMRHQTSATPETRANLVKEAKEAAGMIASVIAWAEDQKIAQINRAS